MDNHLDSMCILLESAIKVLHILVSPDVVEVKPVSPDHTLPFQERRPASPPLLSPDSIRTVHLQS